MCPAPSFENVAGELNEVSGGLLTVGLDPAGVALIRLSQPDSLNALDARGHSSLGRALRAMTAAPDVRVVLLHADGSSFSVGGHREYMESLGASAEERASTMVDAREIVLAHIDCDKPVVAVIQGAVIGGGAAFALFSDIIVAEQSTRIADGHTRVAMAAGDGGALIWPLAVGLTRAKRFLLTSDWLTAVEAERYGLVTEVVADGDGYERGLSYAHRLAAGSQRALRHTKRALNMHLRARAADVFELSLALEMESASHDEYREALALLDPGPPSTPIATIRPETVGPTEIADR